MDWSCGHERRSMGANDLVCGRVYARAQRRGRAADSGGHNAENGADLGGDIRRGDPAGVGMAADALSGMEIYFT